MWTDAYRLPTATMRAALLSALYLTVASGAHLWAAETTSPADGRQRFLVGVTESRLPALPRFVTDGRWKSVYSAAIDARQGDLLRIRGQVEITNDYQWPVHGQIRIVVDGQPVGVTVSENCVSTHEGHHMPLWVDGLFTAADDRFLAVHVEYRAFCRQARVFPQVEAGYGHLVIEQYRAFPDRRIAVVAGARALVDWQSDRSADASHYGGQFEKRALAYNVELDARAGDLVRLHGQSTSAWQSGVVEMHGQGILINDRVAVSPWSTENTPWSIQYVPLATDGIHFVNGAGPFRYSLSMHGVKRSGERPIVAHSGHLHALRFCRLRSPDDNDGLALLESSAATASSAPATIVANDDFQPIVTRSLNLRAGDVLRITGLLQLEYPADYADALGIHCLAQCELRASTGSRLDASAYWQKYITPSLEHLPLRTEQLVRIPTDGDYSVVLRAKCSREGGSPQVAVRPDQTLLLIDRYGS